MPPHPHGLVPDIGKFIADLTAACRKDEDGVIRLTLPEAVKLLGDFGIVLVDVVGVVL